MASQELWEPLSAALPPLPQNDSSDLDSPPRAPQLSRASLTTRKGGPSSLRSQPMRRARAGRKRRFVVKRRGWAFIAYGGALEARVKRLLDENAAAVVKKEMDRFCARQPYQTVQSEACVAERGRGACTGKPSCLEIHSHRSSGGSDKENEQEDGKCETAPAEMSQASDGLEFLLRAAGHRDGQEQILTQTEGVSQDQTLSQS